MGKDTNRSNSLLEFGFDNANVFEKFSYSYWKKDVRFDETAVNFQR